MTNLKTKKSHFAKSKILLIVLCILGLVFSYSCGCRNESTGPGTGGDGNGVNGGNGLTAKTTNFITPNATLSRQLMVINSGGNDTTFPITITVDNVDIVNYSVSGLEGLILQKDKDNVFKVKEGFANIKTTETEVTLSVQYQKKSTAGNNDVITEGKDKEDFKFKIIKAERVDDSKITTDIKNLGDVGSFDVGHIEFSSGIGTVYEKTAVNDEMNTGDFLTQLTKIIKENKYLNIVEGLEFLEVNISTDNKTATFGFILKVKDQYETTYSDKSSPLKFKVVIGDTSKGQGGTGTWKDTTTK